MKILVTGATGFLGSEIVKLLLEKGFEVVCVARKNKFREIYKNDPKVTFIEADISNPKEIEKIESTLGKNIETVIHTAGLAHQFGKKIKEEFWKVNVEGTENIAELAARIQCKRFILISSVSVYGTNVKSDNGFIIEKTKCDPKGDYAVTKFESEKICRNICESNDLPLTILRPATIIGEGDRGNVFRLIKIIEKGLFFWVGQGKNRKSLIDKKDVARICLEIMEKSRENFEVYNLTAEPVSMKSIVSEIYRCLQKKENRFWFKQDNLERLFRLNNKYLKIQKLKMIEESFQKWLSEEIFSGDLIEKRYGLKTSVSIQEAIKNEVDWYLSNKCSK